MIGEYNMKKALKQALISFVILLVSIEILPDVLLLLAISTSLIVYAIYDSKGHTGDK